MHVHLCCAAFAGCSQLQRCVVTRVGRTECVEDRDRRKESAFTFTRKKKLKNLHRLSAVVLPNRGEKGGAAISDANV